MRAKFWRSRSKCFSKAARVCEEVFFILEQFMLGVNLHSIYTVHYAYTLFPSISSPACALGPTRPHLAPAKPPAPGPALWPAFAQLAPVTNLPRPKQPRGDLTGA